MQRYLLTLLLALLAAPAWAQPAMLTSGELIERMQQGGLVIYWRHAATDHSQRDSDLSDMANCATQRNLNEAGREQARRVGAGFERHAIPVGQVLSSAFCRNRDTARIAFGEYEVVDELFNVPAVRDRQQVDRLIQALALMLNRPPQPPVTNTVIVGHNINLQLVARGLHISPRLQIREGEIAVFEPGGRGPALLGRLRPEAFE